MINNASVFAVDLLSIHRKFEGFNQHQEEGALPSLTGISNAACSSLIRAQQTALRA
jgi:hypothetical protein